MFAFLKGLRTYILVAIAVSVAVTEGFLGIDVPGVSLDENWLTVILGGSALAALRSAIGR